CRAAGIPARAVIGYVGDRPLDSGTGFQIQQRDAHMWLEVYFEDYGWVPFNPAPPTRDLAPAAGPSLAQRLQRIITRSFSGSIDTYLVLATALFLLFALGRPLLLALVNLARGWRMEQAPLAAGGAAALSVVYRRMNGWLGRSGWRREPSMTPSEY